MDQEQSATEPWDEETAVWYVTEYGDHPTNHKTVELAGLKPDDRVLDIGCGSGTAVREAAKAVPEGAVTGVDPSPTMVRIAKEQTVGSINAGRIRFLLGGAEKLPIESRTISFVMAINSIHHWHDLASGLAECRRVLIPGGRLIVGDEVLDEDEYATAEGEQQSGFDVFEAAAFDAGFGNISVGVHAVEDSLMNVLLATLPHE